MAAADSGNIQDQALLASEILEKNADIIQALNTRKDAVLGLPWHIQGSSDDPRSIQIASRLEDVLRSCGDAYEADSFSEMLSDMLGALLPGFAVSEILWLPGGELRGFRHIPQHHFTFAESFVPLLMTDDAPEGIRLDRNRIVYNNARIHGSDPVRGGLIRPLAWLHCFKHIGEKDLLSFVERYGMPFIAASVDPATYDTEKNKIKSLVRNFGSSGGGVFTRAVELQLLECRNNGAAYFTLLEYLEKAVNKVILGQTASSGDSSGWSKGDAQSQVRQDILESDCTKLMRLVDTQIIKPYVLYNCGPDVKLPRFEIDFTPPADKEKLSQVIKTLYDAGFELSAEDASDLTGLKLSRKGQAEALPVTTDIDTTRNLSLKQKYDAMGVAIRAGLLTATPEIEAQTRAELGLPEMSVEVQKSWEATGCIRQPITLKTTEAAAVAEALDVDASALAAEEPPSELTAWLGPVMSDKSDPPSPRLWWASRSDQEFDQNLKALADNTVFGSSETLENTIARELLKARREGADYESQN